jgi:hypothetical protein
LYEKGKKKRRFIFPEMLREGGKEGKKDMNDSEKARS